MLGLSSHHVASETTLDWTVLVFYSAASPPPLTNPGPVGFDSRSVVLGVCLISLPPSPRLTPSDGYARISAIYNAPSAAPIAFGAKSSQSLSAKPYVAHDAPLTKLAHEIGKYSEDASRFSSTSLTVVSGDA